MPSTGRQVSGVSATFAVGNPSSRPRRSPSTTTPRTSWGRPSSSAAPTTSPAARRCRTRVDEYGSWTGSDSGATSPSPITSKPRSAPMRSSSATLPPRRWPKWKSAPTTTSCAPSRPTSTSCTKSSADSLLRPSSNSRTQTTSSRPAPTRSSSLWSRVVSWAGAVSGPHHLRRVAVERDAHRVEAARVGQLPDELQHLAVAAVHPVVRADGDDAAVRDRPGCRHRRVRPVSASGHSPPASSRCVDGEHHARLETRVTPLVDGEQRARARRRARTGPSPVTTNGAAWKTRPLPRAPRHRVDGHLLHAPQRVGGRQHVRQSGPRPGSSSGVASSSVNAPTRNRRSAARCA